MRTTVGGWVGAVRQRSIQVGPSVAGVRGAPPWPGGQKQPTWCSRFQLVQVFLRVQNLPTMIVGHGHTSGPKYEPDKIAAALYEKRYFHNYFIVDNTKVVRRRRQKLHGFGDDFSTIGVFTVSFQLSSPAAFYFRTKLEWYAC